VSNGIKHLSTSFLVALVLWVGVGCRTGPKVETVVEERPDGLIVVQTLSPSTLGHAPCGCSPGAAIRRRSVSAKAR
jgi:hypothetical protein